jgi:hypothetical protein
MVREIHQVSLKIGRCVEHPKIYKVLQRGYKVRIIYFFRKFKSFVKTKKQSNSIQINHNHNSNQNITIQSKSKHHNSKQIKTSQFKANQNITIQSNTIQDNSKYREYLLLAIWLCAIIFIISEEN